MIISTSFVLCLVQLIHAAPSPSRELDIVLVPKQPKQPLIIFEFKDNSKSDESEEDSSNETSSSTSPATTTAEQPISVEESLSKETESPPVTKRPFIRPRSRRAISSDEVSTTESPDDYSDEQNYTSTSTTEGPTSGELVVASQENDDGVTLTRVSIFRIIAIPYNATGNSSEESQEDDDVTSTTASPTRRNFQVHHLRKRQASGYGAPEDEHSGHAREFEPEALHANVTAPTYVGESPAPSQAAAGSTAAPAGSSPAPLAMAGSTPAPAGSTPAPSTAAGSSPPPAGSTPAPSTGPVSASASSVSSPSSSTSTATASHGTTTIVAQAGPPTTASAPAASSTPAGAVAATTAAGSAAPPPAPESLTAAGSSPPPLLCGPPPSEHSESPPPPPPANLMQPTTSAPAAVPAQGSGRGLGY